jgi:putative ABC transport system ATP-binding protein
MQITMDSTQANDGASRGEPLLSAVAISKEFRSADRTLRVLDRVDLVVEAGEVVVVTGRSGAGKSTLLGLLGGLDRPTSGVIVLAGRDLNGLAGDDLARLRREQVGIVFQDFNLLPSWTVLENVQASLLHTAVPRGERRSKAQSILESLGLGDLGDRRPAELSVGQQQRVAVGRALVNAPSIILADEPTGSVDPETARDIHACLLRPVRERGAALIVTTHGAFPLNLADRTFELSQGRLANR